MDARPIKEARRHDPLRAASAVRKAAKARGKNPGSIHLVYGAKVKRSWVLASELELANFLDVESDSAVRSYDLEQTRIIADIGEGFAGSIPDALVVYQNHVRELREVKSSAEAAVYARAQTQKSVQSKEAARHGYDWRFFTEKDAEKHGTRLRNWLEVAPVLEEARYTITGELQKRVHAAVVESKELTFAQIHDLLRLEWRLVFVALFRAHQARTVWVDLDKKPLSWLTVVRTGELA